MNKYEEEARKELLFQLSLLKTKPDFMDVLGKFKIRNLKNLANSSFTKLQTIINHFDGVSA